MANRISFPKPEDTAGKSWSSVAYTLSPRIMPGAGVVSIGGKACGIRSDGVAFFATYDMPWVYPAGFDWTKEAKRRLDTFLDCGCSQLTGVCSFHQFTLEQWRKDDEFRNALRRFGDTWGRRNGQARLWRCRHDDCQPP